MSAVRPVFVALQRPPADEDVHADVVVEDA